MRRKNIWIKEKNRKDIFVCEEKYGLRKRIEKIYLYVRKNKY